jgi:peptidoglycan/LPS O-acetylase OafA/YrhL
VIRALKGKGGQARLGDIVTKYGSINTDNRRPSLPALTSLRFFAALEVMITHAPRVAEFPTGFARDLFTAGHEAVTFFFVLSGFVLTYVYVGCTEHVGLKVGFSTFWRSRIARLAPAYFLGLLLTLPIFLYSALVAQNIPIQLLVAGLALTPAFMQAWWPPVAALWNPPAWSLSVEFFFYAVFPALPRLVNRFSLGRFLFLAFALVVVMVLARTTMHSVLEAIPDSEARRNFEGLFPLFHLPQFIFGIALGRVFLFGPGISPKLHVGMLYGGAVGLVLIFGLQSLLPQWLLWAQTDAGLVLLFGLVIFGGARAGGSWLGCSTLVLLGEASYSMYIFHTPIYFWWFWLTSKVLGLTLPFFVNLALSLVLVIVASVLVYLYVETPLRRWVVNGRRLGIVGG